MKINLIIPVILFMLTGTLRNGQTENKISTEGSILNTWIENSSDKENYPATMVHTQRDDEPCYLIIDHLFVYNNPTVNYRITVKGQIPVYEDFDNAKEISVKTSLGPQSFAVHNLYGKGTLNVSGRGSMNLGQFQVKKINYESSMIVNITGKTDFKENPSYGSASSLIYFALEENWNGSFNWDIETSDPENDALRYDMFKRIVPTKIPDSPHTGRTLKYNDDYPGISTYEHKSVIPGMGTFIWKYSYVNRNAAEYQSEINPPNEQLRYNDDRPKPKDYPVPEGELGPPLKDIKWELTDFD